jgi:hypothetical protein
MTGIPSYTPAQLDGLFEIFSLFVRQYLGSWVAMLQPVEIVSIGENNRFVNVLPLIQQFDTNGNLIQITGADTIYNIPIMHPFGTNGEISFNPAVGDKGLLIAGNFDVSNYKKTQDTSPIGSSRSFNWADGFFLPISFRDMPEGLFFRNKESSVKILPELISIIAQAINLGGEGGSGVARLGDEVTVEVTSGSSAGTWKGTITSASEVVKAV